MGECRTTAFGTIRARVNGENRRRGNHSLVESQELRQAPGSSPAESPLGLTAPRSASGRTSRTSTSRNGHPLAHDLAAPLLRA